ncbi:hypothetical protein ACFLZZ_01795 [Nanoarchaeota archaeon]
MARYHSLRAISWNQAAPKGNAGKGIYGDEKNKLNKEAQKRAMRKLPPKDPIFERKKRLDKVRPLAEIIKRKFKECRKKTNYSGPEEEAYVPRKEYANFWCQQTRKIKGTPKANALICFIIEIETGNLLERLVDMGTIRDTNRTKKTLLETYEQKISNYAAVLGKKGKEYKSLMYGVLKIQPKFEFKPSKLKAYKK